MKKEDLVEIGLEKEQIDKVFKLNGLAIESARVKSEEIINGLKEENVKLTADFDEAKGKLENLPNVDELNSKITAYEEQVSGYEAEKASWEENSKAELDKLTYNFLLENSLSAAGAKSTKLAMSALNSEAIKLVDGKLEGLDEELQRVNTEFSYLFGDSSEVGSNEQTGSKTNIPRFTTGKIEKLSDNQMSSIEKRLAKYN